MTLFRIARDYLRSKKLAFTAIMVLQFVQVILSLVLPAINARIIDDGVLTGNQSLIWQLGIVMLVIAVVQIVAMVGAIYIGAKTAMELGRDLRTRTFRQVQSFSAVDQAKFGAPTLITRTTNDVNQVQMVIIAGFTIMVMAPLMGIGGVVMAIQQNVKLSALLIVVVPLLALLILTIIRILAPRYELQQKLIDRVNTLLREQLSGVRVIRAFIRQDTQREKFADTNTALRRVWVEIGVLWAFMIPASNLIVGFACVAVVWFSGHLISAGDMQVGALTAYISYLMMIMISVMISGMIVMMYPRGEVSAKRLQEIFDVEPSITAPASFRSLPSGPLTFALENVGLQYPGAQQPVLHNISMSFVPGKTTALIGSTGSGKSSLVRLLPRMLDATTGQVTAGGISVRDVDPHELRSRIALVPQTAFLFSGTIASNVAGSASAKDTTSHVDRERVERALQAAQAWEFVEKLPGGIDAEVESGGKNFSGGQRQRLTIARAIYRCLPDAAGKRQADLLVFDDSFSALDYVTDARLRNGLRAFIGDTAVLIVAQRVATIRDADEIHVLEAGTVVGSGTHDDLLATCETYQEIVASQIDIEAAL